MTESDREQKGNRDMVRAAREISRAARDMSRVADRVQRYWQTYDRLIKAMVAQRVEPSESAAAWQAGHKAEMFSDLPEEEVALIADKSVHRVRKVLALAHADEPKAPPPTAEEIQAWEKRREERRKREAS